ncbi:hypothetical protein GCM10009037_28580 [Halarchaeum grantii]|uniref:Uncharacterized protein n=1 Tax=Halarchaeum grantii TaxID=1193105 RepID=A0A830F0L8_9EURY|nr:hypothetical protein [Halarchaeum grantii]GGL43423.1 hypothetical protein GCM10009037_28580 [Halarchaeum grantii]
MNEEAESFVAALRKENVGRMRRAVAYDGEEYDILYTREDVEASMTAEEIDETTKNLILKGFDDELDQPEFARFGHLDMSVRWFHGVVVLQVPLGDWSGIIVAFDRDTVVDTGAFTDIALDYIEDSDTEMREADIDDEDDLDDAVEEQFG